jgi:nucleotide-binding universal stress UspA family protein
MKILVPVDGSKNSMEGVRVALDYAKTKGADITIMTVIPFVSGLDLEISAKELESLTEKMNQRAEEVLESAQGILKAEGVSSKTILSSAISAADEILGTAEKDKTNLIIIGNRGLGGAASRFLMGSVASKVAAHAPCSVYIVRPA